MNARLSKGNFLSTRVAVVGLAALAAMGAAIAANFHHVWVSAGRGLHGSAAISRPEKSALALERAPQGLQSQFPRGTHQLPADAMPVISATLGQHSPQYKVKKGRSGYSTENPANHLTARFTSEGVGLQRLRAQWGMQLTGWGYDGNVTAAAKVAPHSIANRVEYARENLTEWYVNGPLGLEQSFRIAHAPWSENKGQHTLTLSFALKGNWNNSAGTRNQETLLQDESGRPALRYGGLTVHDASGRVLTSWMDVHAQNLQLQVAAEGAEFPVTIDPTYTEIAQLNPAPSAPPDFLMGVATAVSDDGTVVVVGACGINSPIGPCSATLDGAVYIFVKPSGGWNATQQPSAILTSGAAPNSNDEFGESLAMSADGKTIVVAAPQTGLSYVFVAPSTESSWVNTSTPTAMLYGSGGANVGGALAIDQLGDTIATLAYNTSNAINHVNVYVRKGSTWGDTLETAQLESTNAAVGDGFGSSVGINGNGAIVVAGAPAADNYAGEAYVFLEPSGGWANPSNPAQINQSAVLLNSDPNTSGNPPSGSELGCAAAIDQGGDTIVVGALYQNGQAGEAYVYVMPPSSSGGWSGTLYETARLEPNDSTVQGATFGQGVSISDDGSIIPVSSDNGGAYVFTEPSGGWGSPSSTTKPSNSPILNGPTNPIKLTPRITNETGDYTAIGGNVSGNAVASGATGTVLVSVPGNNSDSGSVFLYEPQAVTCPTISISPSSLPNATVGQSYSEQLSATGGTSPLQWTISSAPSWLNISTSGELSGTPTGGGTFTFTTTVTDKNNCQGEASLTLTVNPAATTTTITSTSSVYQGIATLPANYALVGNPVTVSFTVQPQAGGTGTPTGTVTVSDGSGDTCSNSIASGSGSCQLSFAMPGTFTLMAQYTPDANSSGLFAGSSSTYSTAETVLQMEICGGFSGSNSGRSGSTVNVETDICLASDVTGTPTASVPSCLQNATCTIQITGGPNIYTLALTILLKKSATSGHDRWVGPPQARPWPFMLFWVAVFFIVAMHGHLVRRKQVLPYRTWAAACFLLLVMLMSVMSACSSSAPVTPPGSYTVNVNVAAGKFSLVVPFKVTVTQ